MRCWPLFLITTALILLAQESGRVPQAFPPPPPVMEKPKPVTPARIRVGCQVQRGYFGPAAQWFNPGVNSLSDVQIATLEGELSANPGDICARGYLIAHVQGHLSRRMDHVFWMIENHPEWDGFMLNLSPPGYGDEKGAFDRVRPAWLQQVGPEQRSGTVLHHAAVFFEWSDPDFAEALLKRAIDLEPNVPFHVEGLGILYGRAQHPGSNPAFAARAKSILLSSTDWLIVAGAVNAMRDFSKGDEALGRLLLARLGELPGNRISGLPSLSDRYRRSQCEPVPLLRRCVDSLDR